MFTLRCGHSFCLSCTRAHLEKLITECEVSKLKCLDYECRETFVEEEYKLILDDNMFRKMQKYRTALEVGCNSDLFFCPNTACEDKLSIKELKKAKKKGSLSCPKCQADICRKCLLTSHVGKPCVAQNDAKFRLWATGRGVKNCPTCKART